MPRDYKVVFHGMPEQENEESWGEYIGGTVRNIGKGLANTPSHFADSFVTLGEDLASWATGTDQEWFDVPKPFDDDEIGISGRITQEAGSFAIGLISGSAILSGLGKAGKLGALGRMAAGAYGWKGRAAVDAGLGFAADFALGDTEEGNLSTLLNEFPALQDSVLTYFRHEDDDTNLEKRLKNAMEGLPLGIATDTLFEGFRRVLRHKRAVIDARAGGDAARADEMIAKETGITLSGGDAEFHQLRNLTEWGNATENATDAPVAEALNRFRPEEFGNYASASEAERLISEGASLDPLFRNVYTSADAARLMQSTGELVRKMDGWTIDSVVNRANAALESLGADRSSLIQELKLGAEMSREASAKILVGTAAAEQQSRELLTLARKVLADDGADPLSVQQFLELADELRELTEAVLDFRRNSARVVTAHRAIIADGKVYRSLRELSGEALSSGEDGPVLRRMLRDNLDATGGRANALELAKELDRLAKSDPDHFLRNLMKAKKEAVSYQAKAMKTIGELRTANILSGVATQGVNVMGNLLNWALRDGFDQLVAAGWGALKGERNRVRLSSVFSGIAHSFDGLRLVWKDLGRSRRMAGSSFRELREQGGTLHALVHFIEQTEKRGMRPLDPVDRMKAEGLTPAVSAKYWGLDEKSFGGTLLDFVGKAWRAPSFGVMGVMDRAATDMAYTSALSRELRQHALSEGMSPQVMQQFEKRMRQAVLTYARDGRIPDSIRMSPDLLKLLGRFHTRAIDSARAATFKHPLDPDGMAAGMVRMLNREKVVPQIIKAFVTPFIKTPVNILDTVWQRTPLFGQWRKEYQTLRRMLDSADPVIKARAQEQFTVLQARMITGGAMYATGASLYCSGKLTGAHDKEERESLFAAGIPEYSVNIGGKWYSYNRLDPIGSFLGITADSLSLVRYCSSEDADAIIGAGITVLANNLLNKTYMQGLTDLSDLVGDPKRYFEPFAAQQIQAIVPFIGLQRSVNIALSPEQKELRGFLDRVLAATVLRGNFPDKVDMFGEPVVTEKTPLALILGIRTVTERTGDPVRMELAKYSLFPKDNLKRILGEEIDSGENRQFKLALKELGISEGLHRFITGKAYANMNDSMRIKSLRNLINRYRDGAKRMVLARNPELRTRVLDRKKRLLARLSSTPRGARTLAESWKDIRSYRVEEDGDE